MKVKLNDLEIGAKYFGEYARCHSDKTAKTGFVGFDITYLGDFQEFLDGIFLCIAGVAGLYRGVIVLRSAPIVATGLRGGVAHQKISVVGLGKG